MPAGQPTKYRINFCKPARALCERGATHEDLAKYFEVNVESIYEWKKVHPEFSNAIKDAKLDFDTRVERALYERAIGYSHEDVHFAVCNGELVSSPTTKHYPPDATSMIFWLKNRKPKEWREKTDVALQNADGSNIVPQSLIDAAAILAKQMSDKS